MAETAAGDETPPANAIALSDDDVDELVEDAVGDLRTTDAPDDEPEPKPARRRAVSETDDAPEQTSEGEEGEAEPEAVSEDPTTPPTPAPDPARAEAPAPKGKPFKFKASGAEHVLHGVDELPDGTLRVSKDATPQFRGILSQYVELQRTSKEQRRNDQREIQRLTRERSEKDLEADAVTKLFKDIQAMSPEQRWAWAENFTENSQKLQLEIERQQIDRDRKRLQEEREGPQLLPEEEEEQTTRAVSQEVYSTFTRLLATPEAKHLPDEDRKALYEKWQRRAPKLALTATKDMPEIGVKKGQKYFDDTEIVEDFNELVALRKKTAKTVTTAQKNAKLNADLNGRRNPPPAVRGGKSPAVGGKKAQPDLRGKKREFKKAFLDGQLDAPDDD